MEEQENYIKCEVTSNQSHLILPIIPMFLGKLLFKVLT